MYDTLYDILNKSENASLQYSIFCEKVLDRTYLLKLNNVFQTSSKRFVEFPPICLFWCLSYIHFPRWYFFCGSFVLFMSCVCHTFTSVHCCLVVTCWERADLLALVCDVYCVFVTFPCQVWYLIVLFPDLCSLSYFIH